MIFEKTCWNYMHLWEYKYNEKKKRVYYDGYERLDIMIYKKEWLKKMFKYQKYMKDFNDNILDIILEF